MCTEAYQLDYSGFLIPPNQQSVTFHVTLHISFIIAGQCMGFVFFRDRQSFDQQVKYVFQFVDDRRLVLIAFEVFLKLGC